VELSETIHRLGGLATRGELVERASWREIAAAVEAGSIVRLRRGHYGLAGQLKAERASASLNAVISHESAALHWGWRVKEPPEQPIVTVPRRRKVHPARCMYVDVRHADLRADQVVDGYSDPVTTVIDCARALPFDAALAVADSALRSGQVTRAELAAAAEASPRTGRAKALRVARTADGRAANPFESVVRAIADGVPKLVLEPQVQIAPGQTPDLVDRRLRIVVECDSWTFHAEKGAFQRDIERYNEFALDGWLLIRIGWEHAMRRPEYVLKILQRAVVCAEGRQLAAGATTIEREEGQ